MNTSYKPKTINQNFQGWPFPLNPSPFSGRLSFISGEAKIRQSIWLILSTAPGERLMRPDFGCDIHDLIFKTNTTTLHALIQQKVYQALKQWEPRIDVIDVQVQLSPHNRNNMLIAIDYQLKNNNTFYNLIYPLFLNEERITEVGKL